MVSAAAASTDNWRSSTFASSAVDLMSQRAQRLSAAVTHATPRSRTSAPVTGRGAQNANTVRGMCGSGACVRPGCAPRVTCQYT